MTVDQRELQEIIDRVSARPDFTVACQRRDLGTAVELLGKCGITQGQIAGLTGIAQGRLSDYKTGKHIPRASSIFQQFADGLNLPAPARLALGLAPSANRAEPQARVGGLDLPADTFDLQILAEAIGRRGNDVKRREMLQLAAQIGSSTVIAQNELWERLAHALTKPTAMDESIVREMEARSAGFHRLEELMPAHIVFKGVAAHLKELSTLLSGTAADPDELRRRLLVVAGKSSVLAGWVASDIGDTTTARNYYDTAERAAKEADDPAISACALAYRSYIPSTKGAPGRARVLLAQALEAAEHARTPSSGTISWLAARHAEESAALGDKQQALASWGKAAEAYSITDTDEDRVWTRFLDQNRFDSYRIATYAKIGKLDQAQEIANAVLERLDQPDRKKAAIILEDIAVAHLTRGAVMDAARLAKQGLSIVRETEFAMWLPRFQALGQGMKRYQTRPAVQAYLEELSVTRRQFGLSPR